MEAEYRVIFRITSNVDSDGFPFAQFPLYGGSVTTPDSSTVIVIEYVNRIWRLSKLDSPAVSMTLPQKYSTSSFISAEDLSDIIKLSSRLTFQPATLLAVSRLYLKILTLVLKHTCPLFSRTNALKDTYNNASKLYVDSAKKLLLFIAHTSIPIIGQYS